MMYTTQSKLVAGSRKTGTDDRTRSVVLLTLAFGAALAALIALATTAREAQAAFPGANGKIVFASDRFTGTGVDNPTGDYEIFTMNPNGTGITQLTNNTAFDNNPSFSADGRWVVFRSDRDGNAEIYVMNALDGSSQKRLTRKAAPDSEPAWSANGKKVAFTSYRDGDEEIHTMKARPEGSKNRPKNLTKNDVTDYVPDWQPLVN